MTGVRAALVAIVAWLVLTSSEHLATVVALAAVALALDAVDGRVARATGTVTPFGARFDMETDAALILVLSVLVSAQVGSWVLLIGAARYLLLVAGWVWPWLDRASPPRRWAKVVAAVQGVVLVVVATDLLPYGVEVGALVVALALLAESFGRQVGWLVQHRHDPPVPVRRHPGLVPTVLAVVLVQVALALPDLVGQVRPTAFLVVPLEALVLVGLALVLPTPARRAGAVVVGLVLALVLVGRVLDLGFSEVLDRPFDPVIDVGYLGHGVAFVRDTLGRPAAIALVVGFVTAALALLVLMPLAVLRLSRVVADHPGPALRTDLAVGVVWVLCASLGQPVASAGAAAYAYDEVARIPSVLRDQREFAQAAAHDPLAAVPAEDLLTGLRGKDVLLVFVESYGRVAVQDSPFSASVGRVLDAGTARLEAQGYGMRSAFLTSPTFGAGSWLAHSTLQSGLWVDSQLRYDVLVTSDRQNLSTTFRRAGWRTVSDVPANTHDWPQGRFYGFDQEYDARNVGYRGPRFGYPTMPDQYTLDAFRRLELAPGERQPVMAEIDLISSHFSWATLPRMVPWAAVGDGSVIAGQPEQNPSRRDVYSSDAGIQAAYARSIRYSLDSVIGYLSTYVDPDTVMVFLGDHQPNATVSGHDSGHDVPVTVVAQDPRVLEAISSWHWQPGLRPDPDAPTWRMDTFRDRFLDAFGSSTPGDGAHSDGGAASDVR